MNKLVMVLVLMLVGCGKEIETVQGPQVNVMVERANILCDVYDLNGFNISKVPDFSTIPTRKVGTVALDQIDAASTNNQTVFPKFKGTSFENLKENFGLSCNSNLLVPVTGSYNIQLTSDDGSKLFLDGSQIITNDGTHGMVMRSSNLSLAAGKHPVRLEYVQGGGDKGLFLTWNVNGVTQTVINAKSFERN